MSIESRRTPCVGICSTTYGDLVCRGCKRFAHEIVDWNAYTEDQRLRVWTRLYALRDACVAQLIDVADDAAFAVVVCDVLPQGHGLQTQSMIYELLRRRSRSIVRLVDVGLRARTDRFVTASAIRDEIDREFYARSRAVYERSFHTAVDG